MRLSSACLPAISVIALLFGSCSFYASGADLPYQNMVVFGDSLSDNGNLYAATGGIFPAPYPNPPFPSSVNYTSGRLTDGPDTTPASAISGVWNEQLSGKIGLPVSAPAAGGGTNYAFGGAETGGNVTISNTLGTVTAIGMAEQVGGFLSGKASVPSNSLYVFWGGANDIFDASSGAAARTAAAAALTNVTNEIGTLASEGGKYFLWVDLPPLDQTPAGKASAFQSDLATASQSFNAGWKNMSIPALEAQFPGISITGVDVYSLFEQILLNPAAYGLSNVTDPSQGASGVNPDRYLFWDMEHPTTAGDALIADLAAQELDATLAPEPASMTLFAIGLGLVAVGHRRKYRTLPPTRSNAAG
jgi:phospholipase/lecithinase/hemolysin